MRHLSIKLALLRKHWHRCIGRGLTINRIRGVRAVLLGLAAFSTLLAICRGDTEECIPREWAISVVDPNLADADTFVADTSIFVDAGKPRIFYARGPIGID